MEKKNIIFLLMLAVGWAMGYGHHYIVSKGEVQNTIFAYESSLEKLWVEKPFVRKVSVKTTAYTNDEFSINIPEDLDGKTATNKDVRRGFVAADWRVFPPGTRIYIPGYGEGIVEDRGGKVRGHHLDLYVDSNEEAMRWGVKNLDVYVIEEAGQS